MKNLVKKAAYISLFNYISFKLYGGKRALYI